MKILKIEVEKNGNVDKAKSMAYSTEKEFFTALVTLCDELEVDIPLWTTYEERILEKVGHFDLEADDGGILRITSYSK